MARAYTAGTAALTLDVPFKWLDNVLSHHTVPGVTQARQGIARRVSVEALISLSLTILIIQDLDIPTERALSLAITLGQAHGHYTSPKGIRVEVDLSSIQAELLSRLAHAVEVAPAPKRGRPPIDKTGRLD